MRKSIILTVVAITALAIAGLGGVFADYSDIETSHGNYLETGDLDLVVTYAGLEWEDPIVPVLVNAANIMPECYDKSFHFDLHNVGNYTQGGGFAYIHIKNIECSDNGKTEPELAAETGATPIGEDKDGNPVYADPPLGEYGENCTLSQWIDFAVYVSPNKNGPWTAVNLSALDKNGDGNIKLNEVECTEIFLGDVAKLVSALGNLPPCVTLYVKVDLMLEDIPEEALGYNLFDERIPSEAKWNCWPTNALQNDEVTFDIALELFQFPKGLFVPTPK
jgi:hypothetical protein